MRRISNLLRNVYLASPSTLRAAKPPPAVPVPQTVDTEDIMNIYKDKADPDPLKKAYPPWLYKMMIPEKNIFALMETWRSGDRFMHPEANARTVTSILHQLKKMNLKEMNKFKKENRIKSIDDIEEEKDYTDLFEKKRQEMREAAEQAEAEAAEEGDEEDEDEEEEEGAKKKRPEQEDEDEKEAAPPPGAAGGKGGAAVKGAGAAKGGAAAGGAAKGGAAKGGAAKGGAGGAPAPKGKKK